MSSAITPYMKTHIILLVTLLVVSIKTFAADPATPIKCSDEGSKKKVEDLANSENPEDFKAGLKAAGKKLRDQFASLMNFQDESSKFSESEVRSLIYKAACIMQLATQVTQPNDLAARYNMHLKTIEATTIENLDKLPADLEGEEVNVAMANRLMLYNRGPIAYVFALFDKS